MEKYVERLLITLFGREAFLQVLIVERAHRSLTNRSPPGAPPRPIIVKLLNYRDRDPARRLSRDTGPLKYEGMDISIYPDFTMAVQDQQRKFLQVKKKLQQLHIPNAMLFPAHLELTHSGKHHFFTNPQHVTDSLKSLPKAPADPPDPHKQP